MLRKKITILLLFLSHAAWSQQVIIDTINVPLSITEHGGLCSMRSNSKPMSAIEYKQFIVADSIKDFSLHNVELFSKYELIDKWVDKNIDTSEIRQLKNLLLTDKLPTKKVNHQLSVLVYRKYGKKYIILDKNNNRDFTDDVIYTFDNKITKQSVTLTVDLYLNGQYIRRNQTYELSGFDSNPQNPDLNKFALIKDASYYGSFKWHNKQYHIQLESVFQTGICYNYGEVLISEKPIHVRQQEITDFLQYGKYKVLDESTLLRIRSYNSNDLSINFLIYTKPKSYTPNGNATGYLFPNTKLKDMDGRSFTLADYKGKYVLLDVWGSWCVPCISGLPELVNTYNKVEANKIKFISIAIEKDAQKSTDKIKAICNEKGIKWQQVVQTMDKPESINEQMLIQTFPTLILIDTSGNIIRRVSGGDACGKLLQQITEICR